MAGRGGADNPGKGATYLRATASASWRDTEDALWAAFAEEAEPMLEFAESVISGFISAQIAH